MQRNMIKDKKQNVNKIDNTYIACPMSKFVQYPALSLCTINVLSISNNGNTIAFPFDNFVWEGAVTCG